MESTQIVRIKKMIEIDERLWEQYKNYCDKKGLIMYKALERMIQEFLRLNKEEN